jgi:hypothetical protein
MEGHPVRKMWPSATEWFYAATKDVLAMKDRVQETLKQGGSATWSQYFVFSD